MLSNRRVILAKVEGVGNYGIDSAPVAGTDGILTESISISDEGLKMIDRPSIEQNLRSRKKLYAGRLAAIQLTVEVKGSGTAGTPPEIAPLLKACRFNETTVVSTSVTYNPLSGADDSCTIWDYLDGKLTKFTGCRGNVSFNYGAGDKIMATFSMVGHRGTETDTAIVSPAYDSAVPAPIIGAGFSFDSYAAIITSLSLDMGNKIITPADFNGADGFGEIKITKRDPNGSFDPDNVLKATYDFQDKFASGAVGSITTGAIGSAGNRITTTMPACSIRELSETDNDGEAKYSLGYGADDSTGDDSVSLFFD